MELKMDCERVAKAETAQVATALEAQLDGPRPASDPIREGTGLGEEGRFQRQRKLSVAALVGKSRVPKRLECV